MKNFKLKSSIAIVLFASIFFSSCERGGLFQIKGQGSMVTQEINVSSVTGFTIAIPADVYITKGDGQSISIEGQQNIIDNIETDVRGGVVTLEFDKNVGRHKDLVINITVDEITYLELLGSGSITTESTFSSDQPLDLIISGSGKMFIDADSPSVLAEVSGSGDMDIHTETEEFVCNSSGSGNFQLKGNCSGKSDINITGSGNYESFNFSTSSCSIEITGSGDAELRVSENLDVEISGSGDVYYKGSPAVSVNISGSGKVENID